MPNLLSPSEWKEYREYKKRVEAEKTANEAKAVERIREEQRSEQERRDKWLQENAPKEWEREVERREARKREAEQRARKAARNAEWVKSFESESLEDIADEIIKAHENPAFLPSLLFGTSENIHRMWANRIMKARRRALAAT